MLDTKHVNRNTCPTNKKMHTFYDGKYRGHNPLLTILSPKTELYVI